ncbi:MAG: hypothetical protein ABSE49_08500 [Polyangiaceae bacterium]
MAALAVTECSGPHSVAATALDGDADGGSSGAPCEWACPSGDDGGVCTCGGNTATACPASASESAPCDGGDGCMGCYQGAGFYCMCSAGEAGDDDGGRAWQCVGTERACTGGTF